MYVNELLYEEASMSFPTNNKVNLDLNGEKLSAFLKVIHLPALQSSQTPTNESVVGIKFKFPNAFVEESSGLGIQLEEMKLLKY